jgi:hypothetical protein
LAAPEMWRGRLVYWRTMLCWAGGGEKGMEGSSSGRVLP